MRRVVITLAAAVAVVAVVVWRWNASGPSCETTMDFDGISYTVHTVTEEIGATDDLGTGVEQGCGGDGRWSQDVAVSRIAGVDPHVAVVTPVAASVLYVADGVTVDELPRGIADLVAE